jgi:hypothetical protein
VNGAAAKRADMAVDPERDVVFFDGVPVLYREHYYVLLNKPAGYVSATDDGSAPTVLELLPQKYKTLGLFPCGRLDKNTLGLMLLTNNGDQGYEHWRRNGATTFHEYWDSNRSRSHSHPMFGAPVAYFFEYLLGIKQTEESAGYASLVIAPQATNRFGRMSGSIQTPQGKVAVSYKNENGAVSFEVTIPQNTEAKFVFAGKETPLHAGENKLEFDT